MDALVVIGRILFCALFLVSGVAHFAQIDAMTGYAQSRGVPAARAAMLVGGVVLLLGGLSVLLGVWPDLARCCSSPSWSRRPCSCTGS